MKQRNMAYWAQKLNIIALIMAILIIVLCYVTTNDKKKDTIDIEIKPFTVAHLTDGSTEYFFDLTDFDYHYSGIMFYTSHQRVAAYTSGREIYSTNNDGGFWSSSVGSGFHFIDINENMHYVAITIAPIYEEVKDQNFTFFIGNSYEMYNNVMAKSMPRFFTSVVILILGIGLFAYYMAMYKKQNLDRKLLYLAYFTFFCGVWSINETEVSSLLMDNKVVDSLVPYLCLMLVVPPFVKFFDAYLELRSKFITNIIILYSMIQFVVLTALHFLKIREYRQTLVFVQILLFVSCLYLVVGMIFQIIRNQKTKQNEICVVGLSLFLLAFIVDFKEYYTHLGDADKIGRYVFFIFVFILGRDLINDANVIIEKGRRAKQLEAFALTDSMTGLFNRNAFESHAKVGGTLDGLVAVVADANGLKKCNDTYGHEAGDEYITTVAQIFGDVYGEYGNCYRTGGDEFCCIIPAGEYVNLERLKKQFDAKILKANMDYRYKYDIGVALGYACYDSDKDTDFRALVKRADSCMYENKRASKSS